MDDKETLYTRDELSYLQSLPLSRKVQITQARIIEWYQKNEGKVYVSFSGGKDSTVLLDIARSLYQDICAVFIDTGLEYPEVREFVKTYDNITWIKPEMNFRKVIEKYGYPLISKEVAHKIHDARRCPGGKVAEWFNPDNQRDKKWGNAFSVARWKYLLDSDIPVSHMCCDVMKKRPAHKFEKSSGMKPIVATMACESVLRCTNWLKYGCNAFHAKRPISQPMSFWTEQDVLQYISEYGMKIASVYGDVVKTGDDTFCTTKCNRTGCVFCMFGVHLEKEPNRFQRLKVTHPKLWEYCMRPWHRGGLGIRDVLEFIHVPVE